MRNQIFPIFLALVTAIFLAVLSAGIISIFNLFPVEKISLHLQLVDVFVGLLIYVKTSLDFAIFTGNLMFHFPGMKNRISIEIGTALSNGLGTIFVLFIWVFFKEIPLLLFFMIIVASLVLFHLAKESIEEYSQEKKFLSSLEKIFSSFLYKIDFFISPLLRFISPQKPNYSSAKKSFWNLFAFSMTIPFLLGLDNFAGYIPLFRVLHVFGFCVGVLIGHLLLTISLFAAPKKTIQIVRYPYMQLLGTFVFVGLAFWGIWEAILVIIHL